MLNVLSEIRIQQIPNNLYPDRNKVLVIRELKGFKVDSGYDEIIDSAEVVISRKLKRIIQYDTNYGKAYLSQPFVTVGDPYALNIDYNTVFTGFSGTFSTNPSPLLQYGDIIEIRAGYQYYDASGVQHNTILDGNNQTEKSLGIKTNNDYYPRNDGKGYKRSLLFTGYITQLTSQLDVVIKCQDYAMFFFQLQVPDLNILSTDTKLYFPAKGQAGSKLLPGYPKTLLGTLKGMFQGLIDVLDQKPTSTVIDNYANYQLKSIYNSAPTITKISDLFDYTFSNTTSTSVTNSNESGDRFGNIKTEHATLGDFLKSRGEEGWAKPFFYPNSSTLNLSIFRYNQQPFSADNPFGYQSFTFEFQKNIIHNKLEYKKAESLLVGAIVKSTFRVNNGQKTSPVQVFVGIPGGKVFTFLYGRSNDERPPVNSPEEKALEKKMRDWGTTKLQETYYEGYYGNITIFGFPYVRHGDQITIIDQNFPERNGTYKCKAVRYNGSIKGLRQEVTLAERVTNITPYVHN